MSLAASRGGERTGWAARTGRGWSGRRVGLREAAVTDQHHAQRDVDGDAQRA
ncbi:MAG: hypothetical protein M3460_28185 [Actinomycetota bacterium]|nr:hypothetical protein [Actinomycetota bacterium]